MCARSLFVQELYLLGARKFVVFEIDAMGCEPAFLQIEKSNPKCSEKVNSYIGTYNHKLGVMLEKVGKAVFNSTFVLAKRYQLMNDLVANPTRYGESSSLPFKNPFHKNCGKMREHKFVFLIFIKLSIV